MISEGYDLARDHVIEMLESWKVPVTPGEDGALNRELLESVARTSLRTKLQVELADMLVDAVVQAVVTVRKFVICAIGWPSCIPGSKLGSIS